MKIENITGLILHYDASDGFIFDQEGNRIMRNLAEHRELKEVN